MRYFASDNYASIHPDVLAAIHDANSGHAFAYGDDEVTRTAIEKFRTEFGSDTEVYFVFNGTGANVTSISVLNQWYQAVICAETAHIQMDECGALEKFSGCKILTLPTRNGKLRVEQLEKYLDRLGDQHHVQAHVISITQVTELGTVYTQAEMRALSDFAHQQGMYLHVDGARISNAAASLNVSLREITRDVGVDVLSFGGTKNGLLLGEAVVFFKPELANNFKYIRKQSMQLSSKMRFIAAQFNALFTDNLWYKNALRANQLAKRLSDGMKGIPHITITQSVDANAIFAIIPKEVADKLLSKYFFYVWDQAESLYRIMTAFDTKEEEVEAFINDLKTC